MATMAAASSAVAARAIIGRDVNVAAFSELHGLFFHPLPGFLAHLLRQLHAAELRAAHGTEVRDFRAVGRQRFVVVGARGDGIEREIELILPAERESRLR